MTSIMKRRLIKIAYNILAAAIAALGTAFGITSCINP